MPRKTIQLSRVNLQAKLIFYTVKICHLQVTICVSPCEL